jgi:hypothetical protein
MLTAGLRESATTGKHTRSRGPGVSQVDRRKRRKDSRNDPLKYRVWGLTLSPGWPTTNVNSKKYLQKVLVLALWHGRIQAEHVGLVRKKSFIKGRRLQALPGERRYCTG